MESVFIHAVRIGWLELKQNFYISPRLFKLDNAPYQYAWFARLMDGFTDGFTNITQF